MKDQIFSEQRGHRRHMKTLISYLVSKFLTQSLLFEEGVHWYACQTRMVEDLSYFCHWTTSKQDGHAKKKIPCRKFGAWHIWLAVPCRFCTASWICADSGNDSFGADLLSFNFWWILALANVAWLKQQHQLWQKDNEFPLCPKVAIFWWFDSESKPI